MKLRCSFLCHNPWIFKSLQKKPQAPSRFGFGSLPRRSHTFYLFAIMVSRDRSVENDLVRRINFIKPADRPPVVRHVINLLFSSFRKGNTRSGQRIGSLQRAFRAPTCTSALCCAVLCCCSQLARSFVPSLMSHTF